MTRSPTAEAQAQTRAKALGWAAFVLALIWSVVASIYFFSVESTLEDASRDKPSYQALRTEVELSNMVAALGNVANALESDENSTLIWRKVAIAQTQTYRERLINQLGVYEVGEIADRLRQNPKAGEMVKSVKDMLGENAVTLDSLSVFSTAQEAKILHSLNISIGVMASKARELSIELQHHETKSFAEARQDLRASRLLVIGFSLATALTVLVLLMNLRRETRRAHALAAHNMELAHQAEAGLRAKADFVATMSHEIRTPLNGVLGMLAALEETGLRDDQKTHARIARSSATSLVALLSEVLDDARMSEGRLTLSPEPVSIERLLGEVFAIVAPQAWQKGLELSWAANDAPRAILADPARLRQILLNLVSNAVKFTQKGGVAARVTRETDAKGEHWLRVEVEDSGPGVDPADADRIFLKFSQASLPAGGRSDGVGLGLAISARLAEAFGGAIGHRPRPEGGSVFWARIPLVEAAAPPALQKRDGAPESLSGLRVLLLRVDLSEAPSALAAHLEGLGAQLRVARSVDAAEALLAAQSFDAALVTGGGAGFVSGLERVAAHASGARLVAMRLDAAPGGRSPDLLPSGVALCGAPIDASGLRALAGLSPGTAQAEAEPPRLPGLRILLSEDQPINQMIIAMQLKQEGATVELARDGAEAHALAQAAPFDLILLDLHTPRMTGAEAARAIRDGGGPNARAPIVALTADATERARLSLREAGVNEVALKPTTREALAETLLQALAATGAAPPAAPRPLPPARSLKAELQAAAGTPDLRERAMMEFARLADELESACAAGEARRARDLAHQTVGAAGFLALDDLADIARVIEDAAAEQEEDWAEAAQDLIDALRAEAEAPAKAAQ